MNTSKSSSWRNTSRSSAPPTQPRRRAIPAKTDEVARTTRGRDPRHRRVPVRRLARGGSRRRHLLRRGRRDPRLHRGRPLRLFEIGLGLSVHGSRSSGGPRHRCPPRRTRLGAIYDTVRDKIARGALPRWIYTSASMGHGLGAPCDGCDEAVVPADTEVTVGFPGGSALRFHLDCFGAWRVAATA